MYIHLEELITVVDCLVLTGISQLSANIPYFNLEMNAGVLLQTVEGPKGLSQKVCPREVQRESLITQGTSRGEFKT